MIENSEKEKKFTQNDCIYLLLAKLPNGNVHQVLVEQKQIKRMINNLWEFKILDKKIESIDFWLNEEQ